MSMAKSLRLPSTDHLKVVGFVEEWLPVPEFIGYEVSNLGRVRSYRSPNGRGDLLELPRQIKTATTPRKEYLRVGLSNGAGDVKWSPVHTLVLIAFVGPRPSADHQACHNDGDAKNNVLSNLRWDTIKENASDRIKHGTQVRGENVKRAVLTSAQVQEIKDALPFWKKGMGKYFAQKFGVGDSTISAIKLGQTWEHI